MLKRFSFGVAVCSFAQDGYETDTADAPPSSWRDAEIDADRTARIGQAGNAMHVQCMGVVLIYILSRGNMRRDVAAAVPGPVPAPATAAGQAAEPEALPQAAVAAAAAQCKSGPASVPPPPPPVSSVLPFSSSRSQSQSQLSTSLLSMAQMVFGPGPKRRR